jgi:hypothetical protein
VTRDRALLLGLAIGVCSCRAHSDANRPLDDRVATRLALDSFPTVQGRLAVVRQSWDRGDTVLVQLAAADLAALLPASDSTLFVWVTRDRTIARTQWVMDSRTPRIVFRKGSR